MKRFLAPIALVTMVFGMPVVAEGSKATRVGCFQQVQEPAQYSIKRVKIKDSYRQYVKRTNGQIDLMEYPAVYREDKKLVSEAHTVMREIVCN
jgi:hypothetical protein